MITTRGRTGRRGTVTWMGGVDGMTIRGVEIVIGGMSGISIRGRTIVRMSAAPPAPAAGFSGVTVMLRLLRSRTTVNVTDPSCFLFIARVTSAGESLEWDACVAAARQTFPRRAPVREHE